jgi:hypothetical protein
MAKTITVSLHLSNKLCIKISTQELPLRVVLHELCIKISTQRLPLRVVLINQCLLSEMTIYNMQNHLLT